MPQSPDHASAAEDENYPLKALTGQIIAGALGVHRVLGFGFLESVYRRALAIELRQRGIRVQQEVPYEVLYLGEWAGNYRADLVAESMVIVELKTGIRPDPIGPQLTLNYLKASGLTVGLFINFGPQVTFKRVVYSGGHGTLPRITDT